MNIDKGGVQFKVTKNLFWKKYKRWEPFTFKAFDQFLDLEHSFVDVGAWIGTTCLYGAQLSQFCYAVEPDPEAFAELKKNVLLNKFKNLIATPACISDEDETQRLYAHPVHGWNASMSSLVTYKNCKHVDVQTYTLATFFENYKIENCNFIKIDVEGAETKVFPSAFPVIEYFKPTLHLSLHPRLFEDRKEDSALIVEPLAIIYKKIYYQEKRITLKEIKKLNETKGSFDLVFTDN